MDTALITPHERLKNTKNVLLRILSAFQKLIRGKICKLIKRNVYSRNKRYITYTETQINLDQMDKFGLFQEKSR
ncbi:MAG: hypothetical protein D6160_21975 [Ketobacter sp.]|nr:MAG: hypothetical protein D6160_21975 [Ketobacter sp.]